MTHKLLILTLALFFILACISGPVPANTSPMIVGKVVNVDKFGDSWNGYGANVQIEVSKSQEFPETVDHNIAIVLGSEGRVLNVGDEIKLANCFQSGGEFHCDLIPLIKPAK